MKATTVLARCLCSIAFVAGFANAQTPADVSSAVNGTYQMVYSDFGNAGPFTKNESVTVVINGDNDTLCINGTLLSKPYIKTTGTSQAVTFADSSKSVYYSWLATASSISAMNVSQGTDGTFKGQLTGSRTSTATTCAGGTPSVTTEMQSVFTLAAELYPALFSNGSALGLYQGYTYKFFAASGIYVGVKDGSVYLMGGQFGPNITNQGTIAAVTSYLQSVKASLTPIPVGLYKLTLSGTINAFGIVPISVPVNVVINDLPAPSVSDTSLIVSQVQTSLGATGIANVKVVSVNNTASRVTFTVSFSAVLTGLGAVTYNLTYDYTK